ncbi:MULTISPECIES: hypothetical protein [unclassified Streptomyces]|uniref:hypothetical protein n=1 Tax=unclassified Streptomyces TaxID=2593676 RepID=UPI00403C7602
MSSAETRIHRFFLARGTACTSGHCAATMVVVHTFRRRTVVLHETNDRRTELGVPTKGFLVRDSHFEEKFRTIEACWTTHRSPDWSPAPQSLA